MPTSTPLFHRTIRRLYSGVLLGVLCILSVAVMGSTRQTAAPQEQSKSIKFSHKFHVRDAGAACADCHTKAPASKMASDNLLVAHEACQSCHEEQINSKCTFCHTSDDPSTYAATLPAKRKLLFSHETHIAGEKLECEKCHGGVDKAEIGVPVGMPGMPTCYTCHNDVKVSNACEKCHTDLAALRPRDHNRTNFAREHKFVARLSTATCVTCHTQETCSDCHNGSDLVKVDVPGKDLMSLRSPRLTTIDRGQSANLTKVHDLNFKFTHGLAANGKSSDCQTCHQKQTFCATCHEAGGNVNQAKFLPESHRQTRFVTLGVGSGGGLHAKLAKRDIENCASCHDAQGADPACILCHTDADGIRGTNPRTHEPGYLAGDHGAWHSDPGATCYSCHTDANARAGGIKGQKFCGYCHK